MEEVYDGTSITQPPTIKVQLYTHAERYWQQHLQFLTTLGLKQQTIQFLAKCIAQGKT